MLNSPAGIFLMSWRKNKFRIDPDIRLKLDARKKAPSSRIKDNDCKLAFFLLAKCTRFDAEMFVKWVII